MTDQRKTSLLNLVHAMASLEQKALSAVDKDTGELAPTVSMELDDNFNSIEEKTTAIVIYDDFLDVRIERLKSQLDECLAAKEKLKSYCMHCLETAGRDKFEGINGEKISLRMNPPKVDILDPLILPEEYYHQQKPAVLPPREPDKNKIKDAITAGKEVPGARLISTKRLEIK